MARGNAKHVGNVALFCVCANRCIECSTKVKTKLDGGDADSTSGGMNEDSLCMLRLAGSL